MIIILDLKFEVVRSSYLKLDSFKKLYNGVNIEGRKKSTIIDYTKGSVVI